MYYRTFLKWFLIAFYKVSINGYILIRKRKNIAVIINASTSSGHFYCGHFVEAEGIPQSYMLSFSPRI